MEGHLEVFGDEPIVEPIEKPWKKLYFRTKEGRFEWYAVSIDYIKISVIICSNN